MRLRHKVVRLSLLLATLWLLLALPVRAQTPAPDAPLSVAQYRHELRAAIATMTATSEEDAAAVIEDLQTHFATITQVEYTPGEVVAVHSLLDDLEPERESDGSFEDDAVLLTPREVALTRLRGALAQLDATPRDNTAARLAILTDVLARPEFNTPVSLWDRFWQWLANLLSDWMPDARPSTDAGWLALLIRLVPWIITVLIVAAVIWLLTYWLQRVLRTFVTDARLTQLTVDGDLPSSAAEARQQARTAAQSGNYRDAVRRLYLAALLQLAEHDLITYERSLTNREVLVRVPTDSPIHAHLAPVVATFDQVWYGIHEPDLATFHAYEQEIDELATVAQRAATVPHTRGGR